MPASDSLEPFRSYTDRHEEWYPDWEARLKEGRKIILLYTTWFGHREWSVVTGRRIYESMDHCPGTSKCLLTYDKRWLNQATALVFHGRDVEDNRKSYFSAAKLRELRKQVPHSQKWVFLSHENPWEDVDVYKPFNGVFNWTATFSRQSDVFVPYREYVPKLTPDMQPRNYAKEKTGLVAWAASNCRSKLRLNYVLQLQKYINVTVYGRCNCFFDQRRNCRHHDDNCKKELSKYKFYLAFENDFCTDYVTEKYWERIEQGVVPIVLGANYDDGLVIPGTYINAYDFDSIQQLAGYLHYLDKNDEAYNKFFAYKAKFKSGDGNIYCKICNKLSSDAAKEHSQVELSDVFSYKNNCGVHRKKAEKIEAEVKESGKRDGSLKPFLKKAQCLFH